MYLQSNHDKLDMASISMSGFLHFFKKEKKKIFILLAIISRCSILKVIIAGK